MWRKLWFNLVVIAAYTAGSFVFARVFFGEKQMMWIIGGAMAYAISTVHFVLWFTFYTREKAAAQNAEIGTDELSL